jgi:hypothetical protein
MGGAVEIGETMCRPPVRVITGRIGGRLGWLLFGALAWMALFGLGVVSLLLLVTWVVAGPWILAKRLREVIKNDRWERIN